ncbi:MAG: hypothetical protein PVJ52_02885 [Candidatus Woesebacteria bacterium]|jgi:hypothetical protein
MATTPERKEGKGEWVRERPTEVAVPEHIEKKEGVQPRPSQFKAQVTDDSGQHLIHAPKTKTVTITLPADQGQLQNWSKGSPVESLTWFARFWLRMAKKALHFGWKSVSQKAKSVKKGDDK